MHYLPSAAQFPKETVPASQEEEMVRQVIEVLALSEKYVPFTVIGSTDTQEQTVSKLGLKSILYL